MASIRLESLTKDFDGLLAVNDVDLTVPDGQFIALLGPSGCGKTTTMNMISGLETPTSGEVWFDDRPSATFCMSLTDRRPAFRSRIDETPTISATRLTCSAISAFEGRGFRTRRPKARFLYTVMCVKIA